MKEEDENEGEGRKGETEGRDLEGEEPRDLLPHDEKR